VLARIISDRLGGKPVHDILVVGCGSGLDAWALSTHFGCRVIGIDLEDYFDRRHTDRVNFRTMDACALDFPDNSFDLVHSFHALEHIPEYQKAIAEIRRVLRSGGVYCIGTPNRIRIVGYIGVPGFPLSSKIRSNPRDWIIRLRGRFRNELGAHAGYSGRELTEICDAIGPGREISDEYYLRLYAGHAAKLRSAIQIGLNRYLWPSVYVVGTRP
jgi:SAM-dependent methyltransferase